MRRATTPAHETRFARIVDLLREDHLATRTFQAQQTAVIRQRIRMLAPVVAMLVLLWIGLDVLALDPHELRVVVPARVGMAVGLLLLARHAASVPAAVIVRAFLALQVVGFGLIQVAVGPDDAGALRIGYGVFPMVLAAQLAVFPMVWYATLRTGLWSLTLAAIPHLLAPSLNQVALLDSLWQVGLIVMVVTWASHTQLRMLIALLTARRDATHDPLTGLENRRSTGHRLQVELARATRQGEPLAVLMLDLDHFKHVNDAWGHTVGDQVLTAVAQTLQTGVRAADVVGRYGGEEFLAILPSTPPHEAIDVAERLRQAVSDLRVPAGHGHIAITVSIGIAVFTDAENLATLIARADTALYRAKAEGRDRCVFLEAAEVPAAV